MVTRFKKICTKVNLCTKVNQDIDRLGAYKKRRVFKPAHSDRVEQKGTLPPFIQHCLIQQQQSLGQPTVFIPFIRCISLWFFTTCISGHLSNPLFVAELT